MDILDMCFNAKIIYNLQMDVLLGHSPKNGGCRWKILEPNRELTRKSPKKVATIHSEIYNGLGQPQRPHRNLLMVNIFRGQY